MNEPTLSSSSTAPALYQSSGRVSASSLSGSALVLIPVGLLIGVLYSASVVYLPLMKLRCVVTLFTGAGVGWLAGDLCHRLKYRSKVMAMLTVLGCVSVAYYASWAVHPLMVKGPGVPGALLPAVIQGFDPVGIAEWVKDLFQGKENQRGGARGFEGWSLVLVWLVEAALLYSGAILSGRKAFQDRPFCEHCQNWNEEITDVARLPVTATDPAWVLIRNGDLKAMKKLRVADDSETSYVELRMSVCPTCDDSDYLSAFGTTLTMVDGVLKKRQRDLIRFMSVTSEQRQAIADFAEEMALAVQELGEAGSAVGDFGDGEAMWSDSEGGSA